jgi:hypothetical protein
LGLVSAIFRNVLGKPGAADFRDSAEHFVRVLREHGIGLTFAKDELLYADDLVERLKDHNEYRDAIGCWLGEVFVRNFGGVWVPAHALGPAVRVATPGGTKHLFPLGWVYRRADGGPQESIAEKCRRDLGFPDEAAGLGRFTDTGERIRPERSAR